MKKIFIGFFLVVVIIIIGIKLLPSDPAVHGDLVAVSDKLFESDSVSTGRFILVTEGKDVRDFSISIYHDANPQKILFSTLPGKSFVSCAQGKEIVAEKKAHFHVEDSLEVVLNDQTIDRIEKNGETITIHGRCGKGSITSAYAFTLKSISENQLQFSIKVLNSQFNRIFLTYQTDPDEQFFGFGEQFSYFNLKGKKVPIIITEQGVGRGAEPITTGANLTAGAGGDWSTTYACVPHYITSKLNSLFLENYEYSFFDLRDDTIVQIGIFSSQMNGRILYGETPADLIDEYTDYSGKMRALPDWIIKGAVLGLQGGPDKVHAVLEGLKRYQAPVSALWLQDWVGNRQTSFGKQLWWNWELDENRYPDWKQFIQELSDQGIRVMIYINVFLADIKDKPFYKNNLFLEAREKGLFAKKKDGSVYRVENSDFDAGMLDLTNPQTRRWLKDLIRKNMIALGVSGWMADYGEGFPYDAVLYDGSKGSSYHNRYPEEWAKLNREIMDEAGMADTGVFFCRAGYTRSPAYTSLFFTGDQLVSWDKHDGIKTAVTAMATSGLSGYSFNHSDIGGFTTISNVLKDYHRSKELLFRWIEMNAFTTVFRTHEGVKPDVNHQIYSDKETMAHFSRFARIFQALFPYRKALVKEAAETGLPVVRHPFIHYYDDPTVHSISYQQFMLGSEFMIAPVLDEGEKEVSIYLPAGRWVHLWSGLEYGLQDQGETVTVEAPIGKPGVFYKSGSAEGVRFRKNLQEMGLLTGIGD